MKMCKFYALAIPCYIYLDENARDKAKYKNEKRFYESEYLKST
jgi:hypothetical protein